jgi:hypothetical protein
MTMFAEGHKVCRATDRFDYDAGGDEGRQSCIAREWHITHERERTAYALSKPFIWMLNVTVFPAVP